MFQRSSRASARRALAWPTLAASSLIAFACSAPPGSGGDDDSLVDFTGASPTAPVTPGAAGSPNSGVAPAPTAPAANGGEQNPAAGAPIAPSTPPGTGSNSGAGGAGMVAAGVGGAAGAPVGAGGSAGAAGVQPPATPPVAPSGATPEQVTTFFQGLPCGAQFNAFGDGGWQFCLRVADGGAACARGSAEFQRVTFNGGAAVTDVAQVSGQRDAGVGVVTAAGALHVGGITSIDTTPLIPSGVVNYSGGFHASVALVEQGDGFGILGWTDNGAPAPITLPDGAQPIQVSANYGLACALSTAGEVFCWDAGGNHSLQQLTSTPTRMAIARPLQMISVGQNGVCGVSFDATLECQAAWYDSPFLPTEGAAPNFQIRQSTFPAVRSVRIGFGQGIVVRADGTAAYLSSNVQPPNDNPGEPFTGVTDIVAAGGDRGSACVLTSTGSVFCRVGATGVSQATLDGAPITAQAATCPL